MQFVNASATFIGRFPFVQSRLSIPINQAEKPKFNARGLYLPPPSLTVNKLYHRDQTSTQDLAEMSHVYFWYDGTHALNNTIYYRATHCTTDIRMHQYLMSLNYEVSYAPSVAMVGHVQHYNYAHTLHEIIAPYSSLPRHVIERNIVTMLSTAKPFFPVFLDIVGFRSDQIIRQGQTELLFCTHFFLVEPAFCHFTYLYNYQSLHRCLIAHFNGINITPNRYLLINRIAPVRNISNFDSVTAWCRSDFPHIKWDIYTGSNNVTFQAHTFMQARFIFGIHGSDLANNVYMKEGGVHCELSTEHLMWNQIISALATHKRVVYGQNRSIGWQNPTLNIVERKFITELIKTGLLLLPKTN